MKNSSKIIEVPTFEDERGFLTVMEDILPFEVRRIYWIYGADKQSRGGHRHKITKQALVAVSGTIDLKINNGSKETLYILDNPSKCLIVEPEDWHTMFFRNNAVLLVLASHAYDKKDYVENPLTRK